MEIHILDCSVFKYMSRLKRPFSTARGTTRGNYNYIVMLTARCGARQIRALAEAAPRGQLTGDKRPAVWPFLCDASDGLRGAVLNAPDPETCLGAIRTELERVAALAWLHGPNDGNDMPMRGSFAGIEIALLDLGAKAFDLSLAEFLGGTPKPIRITADTITAGKTFLERQKHLTIRSRQFPAWRIKGDARDEVNLDYLRGLTKMNRDKGRNNLLWLDFNQSLSPDAAQDFLDRLTAEHGAGRIAGKIILEQPVPRDEVAALSALQHRADNLSREGLEILIMADESLHTLRDWERLAQSGSCRAINIKVPKAGGMLSSMQIARAALAHDPGIEIYIGGMLATSDITAWANYNLACAMPGFRYTTTNPSGNIAVNIATFPYRFRPNEKSYISPPEGPGLGSDLDFSLLAPMVEDHHPFTARHMLRNRRVPQADGQAQHTYAWPEAAHFSQLDFDSFLLQSAAMARGMRTQRLTRALFTSTVPDALCETASRPHGDTFFGATQDTVGFWWSAGNFASRYGIMICGQKQLTRIMLRSSGVPVPKGRKFFNTARRSAAEYAESIGWPVVVKPSAGGGGRAVTTNIRSTEDLKRAIEAVNEGESFIVEEHVFGDDYRILVTEEKVISVFTRRAARVLGDGRSTIAELVLRSNRARARNPRYRNSLIKLTAKPVRRMLGQQGLSTDSVPGTGVEVILSPAANISQGGEGMDVTAQTHPSVLEFALNIRRGLPGLGHCGIDLLMEDHRRPIHEQRVGVCEVNSYSEIAMHCFPSEGEFVDVAEELYLYNARRTGVTPGPRSDLISVHLHADGVSRPEAFVDWATALAADLGVSLEDLARDGESVSMVATGWVPAVAALAALCITPGSAILVEAIRTDPLPARMLPRLTPRTEAEITVYAVLSGKVQKVGYRHWLQNEARAQGVSGFVRNMSDGTVEVVLVGPRPVVDDLLDLMRKGPDMARVQDIRTADWTGKAPPQTDFLRYRTIKP